MCMHMFIHMPIHMPIHTSLHMCTFESWAAVATERPELVISALSLRIDMCVDMCAGPHGHARLQQWCCYCVVLALASFGTKQCVQACV